jgi:nickel-dependent lactate racemase
VASEVRRIGGPDQVLVDEQVRAFVAEALDAIDLDGRSLCLLVPDATRSCPLPLLVESVHHAVHRRVSALTAVVALGTHPAMSASALASWFGYADLGVDARYPGLHVLNHAWWDPAALVSLGTIGTDRIAELSEGRLRTSVDVRANRAVIEHDVVLAVGPVFPHEVVGFSGGNKYFFPGVAGADIIDISHWLGALITSASIIGTRGITPVRALIDEAATLIPSRRLALCAVVESGSTGLHMLSFGAPEHAWAAAADVSAQVHVQYLDKPVRRVVSIMPDRYTDIWTAAKGFYKVEPVVADGGEVIVYAPHITTFSTSHPEIEEIGYHTRDYFVHQWARFQKVHWAVLAHSTHLRGAGSYDPSDGERDRVTVTLATAIPEDTVRAANLNYLDPAGIDLDDLRDDPDTMVVPDAGETLFRLRP